MHLRWTCTPPPPPPPPQAAKEVQLNVCSVPTAPVLQDLLEADFQKLQDDHKKLGDAAKIAAEATEAALTNETRSSGSGQSTECHVDHRHHSHTAQNGRRLCCACQLSSQQLLML